MGVQEKLRFPCSAERAGCVAMSLGARESSDCIALCSGESRLCRWEREESCGRDVLGPQRELRLYCLVHQRRKQAASVRSAVRADGGGEMSCVGMSVSGADDA